MACSNGPTTSNPPADSGMMAMDAGDGGTGAETAPPPPPPDTMPPDTLRPPDPEGANIVPRLRGPMIMPYVADPARNAQFRCELDERCVTQQTDRVLRFDLLTPNAGPGDLYLGAPTMAGRPRENFEFSTCHRHYHLLGYAEYDLLDAEGRVVAAGHKQSFCLEDSSRDSMLASMGIGRTVPAGERYNCGNQGIHAGYYDLYYQALPCQFIDITNVPPGQYRIRARVNTRRVVPESNYDDNTALLDVTITPRSSPPPMTINPLAACPSGMDPTEESDCGWSAEDTARYCTPGEMVTVGCNGNCTPAVGRCDGDTLIRVCAANEICLHRQPVLGDGGTSTGAIASNDNACGTNCASVTFPCPPVGQFRVLTAARGGAAACFVDVLRAGR
jgi:hypothetical protein